MPYNFTLDPHSWDTLHHLLLDPSVVKGNGFSPLPFSSERVYVFIFILTLFSPQWESKKFKNHSSPPLCVSFSSSPSIDSIGLNRVQKFLDHSLCKSRVDFFLSLPSPFLFIYFHRSFVKIRNFLNFVKQASPPPLLPLLLSFPLPPRYRLFLFILRFFFRYFPSSSPSFLVTVCGRILNHL